MSRLPRLRFRGRLPRRKPTSRTRPRKGPRSRKPTATRREFAGSEHRLTVGELEASDRQVTLRFNGELKEMNSLQRFAIGVVGVGALALVAGCGSTTKEVDSTTYVPAAAPAQVVVAPPVQVIPPTTTSSTSMDKSSNSSESGVGGTVDSSSSHHSESTTVTPSN